MADDHFPFVIYGVAEEDIVKLFFSFVAYFNIHTLLRCRLVSKRWRDAIDSMTMLWVTIGRDKAGFLRACSEGNVNIVNRMLELPESRLDVNNQDDRGVTGFYMACQRCQ